MMSSLFSGALVFQQYDFAIAQVREALMKMPDSRILANSDDELTDYFHQDWKLETIEEDPNRTQTATEGRQKPQQIVAQLLRPAA